VTDQAIPLCPISEPSCAVIDKMVDLRRELIDLQALVRTDSLTGLYNFRHFKSVLNQEMERTRRTNQATALVMIDLDFFKTVNDLWGHEVGNQALISTAQVLNRVTRQLDTPCRYGGEEFAIILPSSDLITATQVAERVREAIESTPIWVEEQDIGLTASLGVALYSVGQADTPEQFIARADACLYQAKDEGRNKVAQEILEEAEDLSMSFDEKEALLDFFSSDDEEELN